MSFRELVSIEIPEKEVTIYNFIEICVGTPFFYDAYDKGVYMKIAAHPFNAVRLDDGALFQIDHHRQVIPTTITVSVTGNLP